MTLVKEHSMCAWQHRNQFNLKNAVIPFFTKKK